MASVVEWSSSRARKNYGEAIDGALEAALIQAGVIVEGAASLLAPVDTGRLRGSITWQTIRSGSKAGDAQDEISKPRARDEVHIGSNVEYAQHVEYGTRRTRAQPYLRPALMNNKARITREFGDWVEKGLKRGR